MMMLVLFMIGIVLIWFEFFFFQAEDGIRDRNVTGVQTCALPISGKRLAAVARVAGDRRRVASQRVLRPDGNGKECVVPGGVEHGVGPGQAVTALEIGRASCRERVWIWVGAGSVKKKTEVPRSR